MRLPQHDKQALASLNVKSASSDTWWSSDERPDAFTKDGNVRIGSCGTGPAGVVQNWKRALPGGGEICAEGNLKVGEAVKGGLERGGWRGCGGGD